MHWDCLASQTTVNLLKIHEFFDFSIITFQNLGGNVLFFTRVMCRLELFAKLGRILCRQEFKILEHFETKLQKVCENYIFEFLEDLQ